MAAPALQLQQSEPPVPRLTLAEVRGAGYPALPNTPGYDPKAVVRYVQSLIRDTEAEALARYKRATYNLLMTDGRQWIDWSTRDKAWRELPAVKGKIRRTLNYIKPILRSRLQRLMSSELNWEAAPRSNDAEERDRAKVAEQWNQFRWDQERMDARTRQASFLAFNCGVTYLKRFWNPQTGPLQTAQVIAPHPRTQQPTAYPADESGQPLVDPQTGDPASEDEAFTYRLGDTDTAIRTIFNVRINPDAWGTDLAEGFRWLLDMEVVPLSVIRDRFGAKAKNVQSSQGIASLRQYEQIVKAVTQRFTPMPGGDLAAGIQTGVADRDLGLMVEYWEAPTDSIKQGRLIQLAGDELMADTELPQDVVPYVPIYDERREMDAGGRASVDDLVDPQKIVNEQWSLIGQELRLHGVGQWVGFDFPGVFDQISNSAGGEVRIPVTSQAMGRSIGDVIQRIPPPVISEARWRLIEQAKMAMFDIGAYHEIQRGQVPPGIDSGIAIQLLQEAENGQLHDAVKSLKQSLIQWARIGMKIARWGYGPDEERWLPLPDPELRYLVQSVKGEDLPDPDTIHLDLEGFKPTSQAALYAQVDKAVEQLALTPQQGLQLKDLGRGVAGIFESESQHYHRARLENLALEQGDYKLVLAPDGTGHAGMPDLIHQDGSAFVLPTVDDHTLHIKIHKQIALDDTKPRDVRTVALMHIGIHQFYEQQQMLASLALQNPQGPTSPGASNGKQ